MPRWRRRRPAARPPLTSSISLAVAIRAQAPAFYDALLRKGVRYAYRYGTADVASNTDNSVYGAYRQAVLPTDEGTAILKGPPGASEASSVSCW